MSYQIQISGISVKGFHGVLPSEKKNGQKFVVDLALKVKGNVKKDDIKSVVDYSKLIDLVNEEVGGKSRNLIGCNKTASSRRIRRHVWILLR